MKVEKTGGVAEEGRCELVVALLARDRRSVDVLLVKKRSCQQVRHLGQRKVRVKKICGAVDC